MTRDDVKKAFPEATNEQIKALLDIHSTDIEKVKDGTAELQTQLTAAQGELKTAQETIQTLEANKTDAAALQKTIDDYKAADAKRIADAEQAQALAVMEQRFTAAAGEREFAHDYIRSGVLSDFMKALENPDNTGKGDTELFEALTKDKEGIFKPQSNDVNMGGVGKQNDGGSGWDGGASGGRELNPIFR